MLVSGQLAWVILQGTGLVWVSGKGLPSLTGARVSHLSSFWLYSVNPSQVDFNTAIVTERHQPRYVPLSPLSLQQLGKVCRLPFLYVPHRRPQNTSPQPEPRFRSIVKEQKPQTTMCLGKGVEEIKGIANVNEIYMKEPSSSLCFHGLKEQLSRRMKRRCQEEEKIWRREAGFLWLNHSGHVLGAQAEKHSCFTSATAPWDWTGTNRSILSLFRWGFCLLWYGYNTFCN